jgi:hypothetical protein
MKNTWSSYARLACACVVVALIGATPAYAIDGGNTITVPVRSNPGASGNAEKVTYTGNVVITSALDLDTTNRRPTVELFINLTGVTARGDVSGTVYTVPTQDIVIQPHKNNMQVDVLFPMTPSVNSALTVMRTGLANLSLNIDIATGAITGATATLKSR